jgi:hypothetical protein
LENDDHDALGETAFVRGHVLSYARYLGLEPDPIARAYDREYEQDASPLEHLDRQVRVAKRPQRPRWLLAALCAAAALIGVSAVGLVHGPGSKPVGNAALPALPPRLSGEQPASRSENRVAPAVAPIVVGVTTDRRSWVEIVADGSTIFSGIMAAGERKTFEARDGITVKLGNAGYTRLTFNGATVPLRATGVWSGTFTPAGLKA